MNHRGQQAGNIGGYQFDTAGHGGRMVCDNPYPCNFDHGIIEVRPDRRWLFDKLAQAESEAAKVIGAARSQADSANAASR